MNAPAATPFIFDWDHPRRRNLAIAGFVAVSLAIHLASFYLFQVVYPTTVSLVPAPQRINLIYANSEQTATVLRWIDAEDPALAATTRRPAHMQRYAVGKVEHIPSYFATEPALKEPPPVAVDLRVPSVQPPGPVPAPRAAAVSVVGIQPTRVTFSNELHQLGKAGLVPASFKASSNEPPQNAQFRIAVDAHGAVRYCFILNSSGDAALDEQARQYLALCRFSATAVPSKVERPTSNGDALVWGIATVEWGNDLAQPEASTRTP
jgi:hypothetical protein